MVNGPVTMVTTPNTKTGEDAKSVTIGFLVCLVLVGLGLVVWLFIDRKRKQQEIYRLTMLSVAMTTESAEHLSNRHGDSCLELGSDSPKCPAMAIIPALARFHSRQLSCGNDDVQLSSAASNACARVGSGARQMNKRSHSADVLTSVMSHDIMGDYAVIRNNDVKASLRSRDRWSHPNNSGATEPGCSNREDPEIHTSGNEDEDPSTSEKKLEIINEALRESIVSSEGTNSDLVRPKSESDGESHRYSLVRMKRLDGSPTASRESKVSRMSTDFSTDLFKEIANVTDIQFEKDATPSNNRKSEASRRSKHRSGSGTGVYEDIELLPRPDSKHLSVTSDDLTDVSDLSETSSDDESDSAHVENVPASTTSTSVVIPEVVVTPAEPGDNCTRLSGLSPVVVDREITEDWLAFQKEDVLLL